MLTTEIFVKRAKALHGKKYDYSETVYSHSRTKVSIRCRTCSTTFKQLPYQHNRGRGCPKCGALGCPMTHEAFVARSRKIHAAKYVYRDRYKHSLKHVSIHCVACNKSFLQQPSEHLRGRGCRGCAIRTNSRKAAHTTAWFIRAAQKVHGRKFCYAKTQYVEQLTRVTVQCRRCKRIFDQFPGAHLAGHGCKNCVPASHSRIAVSWLETEAKKRRIVIQHAGIGKEFHVPGTNYKADGYNQRTKTIFEFYGDVFHGNPKLFSPRSKPHPFRNLTAGALYKQTKERERILRALGYRLVTKWESDFRKERR